jgi:hypothetical protein
MQQRHTAPMEARYRWPGRLIGAFMRIDNAALRRGIVMLVQEIAGDDDNQGKLA